MEDTQTGYDNISHPSQETDLSDSKGLRGLDRRCYGLVARRRARAAALLGSCHVVLVIRLVCRRLGLLRPGVWCERAYVTVVCIGTWACWSGHVTWGSPSFR